MGWRRFHTRMVPPPQPPVRHTSRQKVAISYVDPKGMAPLQQDRKREKGQVQAKTVVFSNKGSPAGNGAARVVRTGEGSTAQSSELQAGRWLPHPAARASSPPRVAPPPRGDSRATHFQDYTDSSQLFGTGAMRQVDESSPISRQNFYPVSSLQSLSISHAQDLRPIMRFDQRPSGSPDRRHAEALHSTTSRWSALKHEDRAVALLNMCNFARMDLYRSEPPKTVTQAICTAISLDPTCNPRLLLEVDSQNNTRPFTTSSLP